MGVAEDILERVRRWIGLSAAPNDIGMSPGAAGPAASPPDSEPAGAAFDLNAPALVPDADAPPPPARRAAVHVIVDEGLLRLADGRLALTREDGAEHAVPLHEVAQVSIHGIAGVTTPAVRAIIAEGCPLIWRDRGGRYLGQVVDFSGRSTEVRRAQYAAQADAPTRLAVARAVVVAKIANTRGLLRRRDVDRRALTRLADQARAAAEARDLSARAAPGGRGLPQGSPISPLLANIVLDPLDRALRGRQTPGSLLLLTPKKSLTPSDAAARSSMARLRP